MSLYPPWMEKYIKPVHAAMARLKGKDRVGLRDAARVLGRSVRAVASMAERAHDRLTELAKANARGDWATLEDFGVHGHEEFKAAGAERMTDIEKMALQHTLGDFLMNNGLWKYRKSLMENLEIFRDMRRHRYR